MDFARWLHVLGAVVWVGGMFFAYLALRPAAVKVLEPPHRLELWRETLARFFRWVWVAVAALLVTGLHMTAALGGMRAPLHALSMLVIGMVMMAIFAHVYFSPYRRLARAVTQRDWKAGGAALGWIRRLVGLNLLLGLIVITVATVGRGLLA
jgi:uncharacterized membrane protein